MTMSTVLIQGMSIEEKLEMMELIWDDLCRNDAMQSPDWHSDVLASREKKVVSSEEEPMDWAAAKKEIRAKTQ